jgi:hypothetical protein
MRSSAPPPAAERSRRGDPERSAAHAANRVPRSAMTFACEARMPLRPRTASAVPALAPRGRGCRAALRWSRPPRTRQIDADIGGSRVRIDSTPPDAKCEDDRQHQGRLAVRVTLQSSNARLDVSHGIRRHQHHRHCGQRSSIQRGHPPERCQRWVVRVGVVCRSDARFNGHNNLSTIRQAEHYPVDPQTSGNTLVSVT